MQFLSRTSHALLQGRLSRGPDGFILHIRFGCVKLRGLGGWVEHLPAHRVAGKRFLLSLLDVPLQRPPRWLHGNHLLPVQLPQVLD